MNVTARFGFFPRRVVYNGKSRMVTRLNSMLSDAQVTEFDLNCGLHRFIVRKDLETGEWSVRRYTLLDLCIELYGSISDWWQNISRDRRLNALLDDVDLDDDKN